MVLLTSNNTRELTQALKRRCLYLWLDYPELEHELAIVRLHPPELDETVARKLVEIIGQVRELDLKKPPSIAESIDWARALVLLGAEEIDAQTFKDTMSVIVKHRTDLDTVAARVGVEARSLCGCPLQRRVAGYAPIDADPPPGGFGAHLLELAEELRTEGVATGRSEMLDAFEAIGHVPWTNQVDFKEALAATLAKSPDDRRIFRARLRSLLLPRRRGPGGTPGGRRERRGGRRAGGPRGRRHQPRHAPPADRAGHARRIGRRHA